MKKNKRKYNRKKQLNYYVYLFTFEYSALKIRILLSM